MDSQQRKGDTLMLSLIPRKVRKSHKQTSSDTPKVNRYANVMEYRKSNGYQSVSYHCEPHVFLAYHDSYARFKKNIGWYPGGYCNKHHGGPQKVMGIQSLYLESLLALEEMCLAIASKGSGPLASFIRKKMRQSYLCPEE